jgi:2,4-dienoyl-CoA reductase (NADPH2)
MARPMLADSQFMNKAAEGREDEINTCIACNQACLDHTFGGNQEVSCLVNPRACHETQLAYKPTNAPKRIAVVGAGPAGLAYSTIAAERGHKVDLFDQSPEIGGQFNLAKRIPGKEEFHETLRYFKRQIEVTGVNAKLGKRVDADFLKSGRHMMKLFWQPALPHEPRGSKASIIQASSVTSTRFWATSRSASASPSSAPAELGSMWQN